MNKLFTEDNFSSRRTTGHNLYDPESLLTGEEIEHGLGYEDKRVWGSEQDYIDACEGRVPVEDVPRIAPRMREGGGDPS